MEDEKNKKAFEILLDNRKFEIDLFWRRSMFFWGFIVSAFVGYTTLKVKNCDSLTLIIAIFGFVCSFCWTMVNRGSKYWQENWETKIDKLEKDIVGELFKIQEPIQNKGCWLSAKKYSVSRITIALSYYVTILWFFIIVNSLFENFLCVTYRVKSIVFFIFTIIWLILILIFAKTSERIKE